MRALGEVVAIYRDNKPIGYTRKNMLMTGNLDGSRYTACCLAFPLKRWYGFSGRNR